MIRHTSSNAQSPERREVPRGNETRRVFTVKEGSPSVSSSSSGGVLKTSRLGPPKEISFAKIGVAKKEGVFDRLDRGEEDDEVRKSENCCTMWP